MNWITGRWFIEFSKIYEKPSKTMQMFYLREINTIHKQIDDGVLKIHEFLKSMTYQRSPPAGTLEMMQKNNAPPIKQPTRILHAPPRFGIVARSSSDGLMNLQTQMWYHLFELQMQKTQFTYDNQQSHR